MYDQNSHDHSLNNQQLWDSQKIKNYGWVIVNLIGKIFCY